MAEILEGHDIPYGILASKMLGQGGGQTLIPFLGAGVSISGRSFENGEAEAQPGDAAEVEQWVSGLGLEGKAKLFMSFAVRVGLLIAQREQNRPTAEQTRSRWQQICDQDYPPTASELSDVLSELSGFRTLEHAVRRLTELLPEPANRSDHAALTDLASMAAELTGLGPSSEPLSVVSSHYQKLGNREDLGARLRAIFANKKIPTRTHRMIAHAARAHVTRPRKGSESRHYYLLTTNYDRLLEIALEELGLDHVVLTTHAQDGKTRACFSGGVADLEELEQAHRPKSSKHFVLDAVPPHLSLVVIYKIHGCLSVKQEPDMPNVVISEQDYVHFLAKMWGQAMGMVPSEICTAMENKEFLFLGYSLRDWNVRSVFQRMLEARQIKGKDQVDYTVVNAVSQMDRAYLRDSIKVLLSDLNEFVDGIEAKWSADGFAE